MSDAVFARRVYLDVWGLLPISRRAERVPGRSLPSKRDALVVRLLADNQKYADHWISFWNDLLRNEDGVSYFSETAGRKSITDWLHRRSSRTSRTTSSSRKLINPTQPPPIPTDFSSA